MTLYKLTSGIHDGTTNTKLSVIENSNTAEALRAAGQNLIQQLQDRGITLTADGGIFAEAYIDSNGRNNDVDTTETSAEFDTDKYKAASGPFVIIEATSISSVSDFAINNCNILEVASGKWQLTCSTGTDEVKRAQIYKTLFVGSGTDGSDARVTSTYITGLTALKTSVTRDVGKRAHFATHNSASTVVGNASYTGTFVDTSTNTDCSSWSYVSTAGATSCSANWQIPGGTTVHTAGAASDEFGTDTSADETDNPATCVLYNTASTSASRGYGNRALILCSGDITWAYTETAAFTEDVSNTDYYTDEGVPDFTATTESLASVVVHDIPTGTFSTTLNAACMTFKAEDWESGADVQFKLTNATEDSGWLDANDVVSFTAFTSEPTVMSVMLNPKTTSPTAGYPSINGVALYGDRP